MGAAYCTLDDVKSSLSGDVPNMGTSHDQSLVNKIVEISSSLDHKVTLKRGDPEGSFSFLAEQPYARQRVYLSSTPRPTSGSFVLALDGVITNPILFDATGADVQTELENLSNVGAGNVTVSGFQGGPWTVDFAGTLVGPRSTIEGQSSTDVTSGAVVVLPMWDGVAETYSERYFHPTPDLYGELLKIDDCVEVRDVLTYNSNGDLVATLFAPADYRTYPENGVPIQALRSIVNPWPQLPGRIGVKARWGRSLTISPDVREGVEIEVIRAHLSSLAGNDDRLGVSPLGKVMTAKAWTSKFYELCDRYGYSKLW